MWLLRWCASVYGSAMKEGDGGFSGCEEIFMVVGGGGEWICVWKE